MATAPTPAPATPAAAAAPAAAAPPAPATAAPPSAPLTATPVSPPTPPPTSTSYAPWGAVPSLGTGVTGWYTNVYLLVLAYLTLPLIPTVWLATSCNYSGIWMVVLTSTLIDLWVMFHPWGAGGVSFAAYLRGQVGGRPGADIEDGVRKAEDWLKIAARFLASSILGKQIAFIWIYFFGIRGFGGVALAALALIILVLIGVARFSEDPWFARRCWNVYVTLLVVILGYWALASMIPELHHSQAKAVVSCLREKVRSQNDEDLKQKAEAIADKMAGKQYTGLSESERIAKLSKEEQAIWARAAESGFVTKSIEAVKPLIGQLSASANSAIDQVKSRATSQTDNSAAVSGSGKTTKRVEYTPTKVAGPITLGDFPPGKYVLRCEGKRHQRFGWGDESNGKFDDAEMDCHGRVTSQGGNTFHAPSSAPIPGPNGLVIAYSGTQKPPKVDECFTHPGGRIQGGINVGPGDYRGRGSVDLWVEEAKDC